MIRPPLGFKRGDEQGFFPVKGASVDRIISNRDSVKFSHNHPIRHLYEYKGIPFRFQLLLGTIPNTCKEKLLFG